MSTHDVLGCITTDGHWQWLHVHEGVIVGATVESYSGVVSKFENLDVPMVRNSRGLFIKMTLDKILATDKRRKQFRALIGGAAVPVIPKRGRR